jgi:hypothetical protein
LAELKRAFLTRQAGGFFATEKQKNRIFTQRWQGCGKGLIREREGALKIAILLKIW